MAEHWVYKHWCFSYPGGWSDGRQHGAQYVQIDCACGGHVQ